ncbi:MAG TPA: PfkB family carbohydrate kinase [Chloroflexota bacterium]|nr:PfkB family carbohydrate kinase [Chloroflexota bacterium]
MTSLVVGSVAFDTVETPFGRVDDALGGTAVYFSVAATLFTQVKLVGVVGTDFPDEATALLRRRGVDLSGLQRRDGRTFRWVGQYDYDMNVAHTLDTRLNVFETFHPAIPEHYRDAEFVFLGNIDPVLQREVLSQVKSPALTALDTMNFWISGAREALVDVVRRVDAILINEGEIRELTGRYNVLDAAREVQAMGPRYVVVKRGEYGSFLFAGREMFLVPAYPTFDVRDTTGAGDSFAGGFIGYLDRCGSLDLSDVKAAVVYGTVMASFTVEDFSVNGLLRANAGALHDRFKRLADITRIEVPVDIPEIELVTEGV